MRTISVMVGSHVDPWPDLPLLVVGGAMTAGGLWLIHTRVISLRLRVPWRYRLRVVPDVVNPRQALFHVSVVLVGLALMIEAFTG